MARVLADTSAIYALLDKSDGNHARSVALLKKMRLGGQMPLLTNFVVAETYGLLVSRLGSSIARRWLFGNRWPIERVTPEDETAAHDILREYEDKDFSHVDATSFSVMKRLKMSRVLAFDRHFTQYGFELLRV
jgi:predicted nucleic acid-binding protein